MQQTELLVIKGIKKAYGPVIALKHADLTCCAGEVHALLGENGAGKSTLVKIIGGVIKPDSGEISYFGNPGALNTPSEARRVGVGTVYQELSLVPDLSVGHNLFLGREPKTKLGFVDWNKIERDSNELLQNLDIRGISPNVPVRLLSLAQKQIIEIAKTASLNPKLILLDEPTAALAEREVEWLAGMINRWKSDGKAVLFISHRLPEVRRFADRITVFRTGEFIETFDIGDHSDDEIVNLVSGRSVSTTFPPKRSPLDKVILKVDNLQGRKWPRDVSLSVRAGEIVGLAGLEGQGQSTILSGIFGSHKVHGRITLDGEELKMRKPAYTVQKGIAYVPAERKTEGLFLELSLETNMIIPSLQKFNRFGFVRSRAVKHKILETFQELQVSTNDLKRTGGSLSGGNQQKIVLGKWLLTKPKLLILYDVTRGVDVGTKRQIYQLIVELASQGVGILLYSSETLELVHLCHRVYVVSDGTIVSELDESEITDKNLVSAYIQAERRALSE